MHPRVGKIDESAQFAATHVPAVGDQQLAVRFEVARLIGIVAPHRPGHLETLEVERTARANVDQPGNARLDQIGRRRLEGFDRGDRTRGKILERHGPRLGSEDLATIVGGRVEGAIQPAEQYPTGFAAVALNLNAWDARRGIGDGDIRQLADVLCDDSVDNLIAVALDVLSGLQRAPQASHDDRVRFVCGLVRFRRVGLRLHRRVRRYRRLRLVLSKSRCRAERECHGRGRPQNGA